jgi:predicted transcriptional regulator YheO
LLAIHSPDGEYDEMINYTSATPDGRPLKSTSVVFRDDDGTPIAGLCINFDISDINRTKAFIDNFLGIKTEPQVQQEEFYQTMDQAFEKLINIAVEAVHKPVIAMDKADKIRVVALLDSSGVFAMKGSTERVAEVFGVSRFTIYNYLDEIRNGQPGPKNEPGS